jgi:ectoine hydroxylase-related dioxygenase (phytanoyl-CoA dioxygenase family)
MALQRLSNTTPIADIAEAIRADGGVIIQQFCTPELLAKLQDELFTLLEVTPNGVDEYFAGTKTRRASRLFSRTRHVADVALNPLFLETARVVLGKPMKVWSGENRFEIVPDVQLGVAQAIQIRPGQGSQPLHRDDAVWMWQHPQFGREARLQIMVAVSEFTADNGGTLVIPGSHLWDDERMPTMDEAVPTEMAAGDALLWVGSLYHGGGNNKTDGLRTGLTMSYDLSMLRQEENHFLSIPIDKVKAMPEELQRLLGWTRNATFMGFVEFDGQMQDPNELLKRDNFTAVGQFD